MNDTFSTHYLPSYSHLLSTAFPRLVYQVTSYGGHATLRASKQLPRMVTTVLD